MYEEEFSKYMNKPECSVEVGKRYTRTDMLLDSYTYLVTEIMVRDGKYYAVCEYEDMFDGSKRGDVIYAYYLEEVV